MEMYDIIKMKRDGEKLTKEELEYFAFGSADGAIPDYQITALLMAMYINGLDREETFFLTEAMKNSGDTLDLSMIEGIKIDKHSTGGVGDKTTLIAAPIAAACGVPIAKMSGRGLGFTGGTIDKLESIPGYRTSVGTDEFIKFVRENGISVIGQSEYIAAADKVLYGLRDVTATVDDMSLIASSIMSKKLALGADGIVLDIKCGSAAFMKTENDARELAMAMRDLGCDSGKKMICIISCMDEPLGRAVGNALEIKEVIDVLKGNGAEDITQLSEILAGHMIYLGGKAESVDEGIMLASEAIEDGAAIEKLKILIASQGGEASVVDDPSRLPAAEEEREIIAVKNGYVNYIDGVTIGRASMCAGAGRKEAGDEIDLSAGIYIEKKTGEQVQKGDVLCRVYGSDETKVDEAAALAVDAFDVTNDVPDPVDLILDVIK